MVNPEDAYLNIIKLLSENKVEYKLFSHKTALTYEDLAKVQKETGFFGVDPQIYKVEWFLFSPVLPTKTVQAKGKDLKKVFENLPNKVTEVTNYKVQP